MVQKNKVKRRTSDDEAISLDTMLRSSPRKLNLVASLIRQKSVGDALNLLSFSRKRISFEVKKVLQTAIANAENNHQLDVDRLFVARVDVGKSITLKRWRARARGRVGKIKKPFSRLTIVVKEEALDRADQKTQNAVNTDRTSSGKVEKKVQNSSKNVKAMKKESAKIATENQKVDAALANRDSAVVKEGKT